MTPPKESRSAGLDRDQIVEAAIELLDAHGEVGLTFRALALRLHTGHGAIQWHLENKAELLMAATVATLSNALSADESGASPRETIRTNAVEVFTAIEAHPWLSTQLFATPWQPALVQLWERIARALEELGVPSGALFTSVSTLVNYIIGAASQDAANAGALLPGATREAVLGTIADRWERTDPRRGSLVSRLAEQLRVHDDRQELLAGIDIILDGIEAAHRVPHPDLHPRGDL